MKTDHAILLIVGLFVLTHSGNAVAQTDFGFPYARVLLTELIEQPEFLEELEVTPAQLQQLRTGLAEIKEQLIQNVRDLRPLIEKDKDEYAVLVSGLAEEVPALQFHAIESVLRPKQMKRLLQLANWATINSWGYTQILLSDEFVRDLNIDRQQKDRLEKRSKKLQKDFDQKVLELRMKYLKQLASQVLDSQQEKDLLDLLNTPPSNLITVIKF